MANVKVNIKQDKWTKCKVNVPIDLLKLPLSKKIGHYGQLLTRNINVNSTDVIEYEVVAQHKTAIQKEIGEFVNGFLACYTILKAR